MALGVLTRYYVNGSYYASYVLGQNLASIKEVVIKRNLNEEIESSITNIETMPDYAELNDEDFLRRLPEILHSACFLSFIALKAGTITIEEALGDEGVLHEVSHFLAKVEGCHKKSLNCLRDSIKKLQEKAIGFYQPV